MVAELWGLSLIFMEHEALAPYHAQSVRHTRLESKLQSVSMRFTQPPNASGLIGTYLAGAERTDIETVISDLLLGRFSDPIEVLAFNTIEHWSDDLSQDVAREIRCRCDIEGRDVPAYLQEFVCRAASVTKPGKTGGPQAWS